MHPYMRAVSTYQILLCSEQLSIIACHLPFTCIFIQSELPSSQSSNKTSCKLLINQLKYPCFFHQAPQLLFFCCSFLCSYYSRAATIRGQLLFEGSYYSRAATIRGQLLFEGNILSLETHRHQRQLNKANNTVMPVRCCQQYTQPLSLAASRGNESYNTNSPSTSPAIAVRNYSRACLAAATVQGWCIFRSELPIVWLLFKKGDYSREAPIQRNTVFKCVQIPQTQHLTIVQDIACQHIQFSQLTKTSGILQCELSDYF